jgi:hypothetical protein
MVVISSGSATSVSANSVSADQVSGTYQFLNQKGVIALYAKASATGLFCTMTIGGVPIINDQAVAFTGTAGTLSKSDNLLVAQAIIGGRAELKWRNSTASSITVDHILEFN